MSAGVLKTGDRRVLREARTEAVVVLALDIALLVGLALVDKAKAGASSICRGGRG